MPFRAYWRSCDCAVDISTIDVAAASTAGVLIGRADKSFVPSTAELALALMLDLSRNVSDSTVDYRDGLTPPQRPGRQLRGRTAGIIGYGAIGSYLAELLRRDRHARRGVRSDRRRQARWFRADGTRSVAQLFRRRPASRTASADTANIIDAHALAAIRGGTLLVNVSRGELVDEDAVDVPNGKLRAGSRQPPDHDLAALLVHPADVDLENLFGSAFPRVPLT